jgi:hypothetical protein
MRLRSCHVDGRVQGKVQAFGRIMFKEHDYVVLTSELTNKGFLTGMSERLSTTMETPPRRRLQ